MNIPELKEKLLDSVDVWADARIDDMVKGNPMLAIPSVYMKRAAHNIIAKNKDKWNGQIDNAALFLADENGNIDADTIFQDVMDLFKNVEENTFDIGFVKGAIGNGKISINLPDNIFTNIVFGNKKTVTIDEDDFMELKSLLLDKE